MTSEQAENTAVAIGCAIVETVKAAGEDGVPGWHLYAVLMGRLALQAFNDIMARLCQMNLLEKRGQCYYPGKGLK